VTVETVLLYIVGILALLVGLAISIGLHELGHLIPAKKFGVRVSQYMIGFGPTIFSRRRGETEYGVKAIPLGGYISMAGMYAPVAEGEPGRTSTTAMFETVVQDDTEEDDLEGRTFFQLPVWKRVIIMLGGPVANLLIAIVLFGIVLMGYGTPVISTTIESVNECVIPATSEATECTADDPVAPALAAGIEPGDRIVEMNGEAITSWEQATEIIRASPGRTIDVIVDRDGEALALELTPLLTERYVTDDLGAIVEDAAGQPLTTEVGFAGVSGTVETVPQPITAVLPAVGDRIVDIVTVLSQLPQRVIDVAQAAFGGQERDPNGLVGVVGIGRIAGEISSLTDVPLDARVYSLVSVVAGLNIALFVFNLIPLLPLDGGHIVVALFEGLRKVIAKIFKRPVPRPVDATKIIPVTLAVSALLVALTLLLVWADIVNPISIL
jgi:membrane-associated protease RseP (regulator of RpoE activity)